MVVPEVVAACSGDRLKVVMGEVRQDFPGRPASVIEDVVRVVHLVYTEDFLETSFVERAVVGDQRELAYERRRPLPYMSETRRILRVLGAEATDALAEPLILVRFGADQTVERVHSHVIDHLDKTDAADT